jgi:serine protease Do
MKLRTMFVSIVVVAVLATIGYVGSLWAAPAAAAFMQPAAPVAQASARSVPSLGTLTDLESTLENVYAQVNPSVVLINVVEQQTAAPNFRGRLGPQFQQPQQASALGSGFVWDTQGHIITNNHVVDGADRISVTLSDGTTVAAHVVGADPDSDLAVLQVNMPASQLHPVQLADSTLVKVGQFAIAIGNPFGEENTMTTGIISALGRSLPVNDGNVQGPSYTIPDVIQTDAPINPGNSGGVLLNADGKVIGVTAAIESPAGTSAGIGFAIPAAIVDRVVPVLIKSGHYSHPYIGISGATLNPDLAQAAGLQSGQRGAMVINVTPGGPAAKAGLRGSSQQTTIDGLATPVGGDVITAIDAQPVKTFDDLVAFLARSTQVNQTVTLTILRDGKQQTVQVTLVARPNPTSALSDTTL